MNIDLTDTTSSQINASLVEARRAAGSPAIGMVLTLVIVTDEGNHYDALKSASEASKEHPSRILVVVRRPGRSPRDRAKARLDAEVRMGSDAGSGETVLLRLHGELAAHSYSVVLPLLLPDAPVVVWWPEDAPEHPSDDLLGTLAQRRITDAAATEDPVAALSLRGETYAPGDTDLSWTRVTPWRSILASSLDQRDTRITSAVVEGEEYNPSTELLALWLAARLRIPVERKVTEGPGITAVRLETADGEICLDRADGQLAELAVPGQPDRHVALHRRTTAELIAEELRRLDPDEAYAEAVQYGVNRLAHGSGDSGSGSGSGNSDSGNSQPPTKKAADNKPTAQKTAAQKTAGKKAADNGAGQGGREVTSTPQVVVHRDKDEMARATAARLIARIVDAQTARGSASIVLTGGRNGNGVLAALAESPARESVDWSRIDLWWGDERFLPAGDPERNVTQAQAALLDSVPVDPSRVHVMAPSDGAYGGDVEAAAEAYAAELAAAARPEDHGPVPSFDVLMLGVGPDTHVASLFPEHPGVRETELTVVGVHGAPKPPPIRVSLTLRAIRAAREVWLFAAGEDKANAAAIALSGAGEVQAPAAGAYGRDRTLWLLDEPAAAQLPPDLYPPVLS